MAPLRIAVTADLHFGIRDRGNEAALALVAHLESDPPDLLIIAGDVGAGEEFEACLGMFGAQNYLKAVVPGNHDVWVDADDRRGDSLKVYRKVLPGICKDYGFHYLDRGPLVLPESDLAIAGSINWYDHSWSIDRLKTFTPDWEIRLRAKRFSRGRHNDFNFVVWPHTDASFTAECVATLERHLDEALAAVGNSIVVTHHPAFRALSYPKPEPWGLDDLLWEAFSGNVRLEEVLKQRAGRIPFVFSGHTHCARSAEWAGIRGYNVGGDYHFKRLLRLDWPAGTVRAFEFGNQ